MFRIGVAMMAMSLLPACATVTRGTKQSFVINSNPDGALATLSTGQTCTTPCKIKLKRKNEFHVTATKDGYQPAEADVKTQFKGGTALAGNLLIGGIVGGGVDASNGSLNSLTPNPLALTLAPLNASMPVADAIPAPATDTGPVPAAATVPATTTVPAADAAPAPTS